MVGITGHHIDRGTRPEDIGGLSKIGLSICFASLLAAMQFGIAGWYLSVGLDFESRVIFAALTALIGSLVVLIIDRNFIYAADTRADLGGISAPLLALPTASGMRLRNAWPNPAS